jgi:hypothetical protein
VRLLRGKERAILLRGEAGHAFPRTSLGFGIDPVTTAVPKQLVKDDRPIKRSLL